MIDFKQLRNAEKKKDANVWKGERQSSLKYMTIGKTLRIFPIRVHSDCDV